MAKKAEVKEIIVWFKVEKGIELVRILDYYSDYNPVSLRYAETHHPHSIVNKTIPTNVYQKILDGIGELGATKWKIRQRVEENDTGDYYHTIDIWGISDELLEED